MDVNKEETTILFEICDDIQCASIFVCTGKLLHFYQTWNQIIEASTLWIYSKSFKKEKRKKNQR
jgi:hypothetical protein